MDGKRWEKLIRNFDEISNVYPRDILPLLIQDEVITTDEKATLSGIKANGECMHQLCLFLKKKPADNNAYRLFLNALEKTEPDLAKKIDETETSSDETVTAEVDPKHFEAKARRVLSQYFANENGAETPLSMFMDILCQNSVFSGDARWTNEDLCKFIANQFVGVEIVRKSIRSKDKTSRKIFVKNVKSKTAAEKSVEPTASVKTVEPGPETSDIKSLSPAKVKDLLKPYFEKREMNIELLNELEKNEISGDILLKLTPEDIKEVAPNSSFGARHLIKSIIEDLNVTPNAKSNLSPQFVSKFDFPLQASDYYMQGKCVNCDIHINKEKRTSRIQLFLLVTHECEDKRYDFIAAEIVKFVAACVNERRNGTIYFGINHTASQHHEAGEVVGMSVSKDQLQQKMNQALQWAFHQDIFKLIKDVIKTPKFVPVKTEFDFSFQEDDNKRWVIEYDIAPTNAILGDKFVKVDPKKIPQLKDKFKMPSCLFHFSEKGKPKVLKNLEEESDFDNQKERIIAERNQEERKISIVERETPNLHDRLQNLITGGLPFLDDDIFPFLMLGPLGPNTSENLRRQIKSFKKHLSPEVVLDFDENCTTNRFYDDVDKDENLRVLTLDNFDPSKSDSQDLSEETNCMWLFCNGYEPTDMKPLTPTHWNIQRKFALQEAMKSFVSIFKKERIVLIICLFSQNQGAIVEACDELLLHFPNQWVLLAESETAAQSWQDKIFIRNRVDKKEDLLDRCIVGMSWEQIATSFKDWCKDEDIQICKIPHSNGSFVEVKEKLLQSWSDVEVVSILDPVTDNEDEVSQMKIAKEVEEDFYRGGQVKWQNFWFGDQVLKRSIYHHLRKEVEKALRRQGQCMDNQVTSSVVLYHQPGAGGTTVAKEILWEFRKLYRCCVVHNISEETCDQLEEIYLHQDDHPKPLLVLLDNMEDEKCEKLRNALEMRGHKIQYRVGEASEIFCVFLICLRCSSLPVDKHTSHLKVLRQELDSQELYLFKNKHKDLEDKFNKNKLENIDPRFLISFNLLKQNFKRESLQILVQEYVQEINSKKEIEIMKVVSLLNTFDANFHEIPVYLLDVILQTDALIFQNTRASHSCMSRRVKWEASVSQGFKVLLNVSKSNKQLQRRRKTIRIFNQLLASEIMDCIRKRTKQSVSDLIQELMTSKIFSEDNTALKSIHEVIRNVIMKRQYKIDQNVLKREKFSKLLLHVRKHESDEKAMKILTTFHDIKRDSFVAQQIARFYISLDEYELAEGYIKIALEACPNNSFFMDTYGQIFLNQLNHKVKNAQSQLFSDENLTHLLNLFSESVTWFRKSQVSSVYGRDVILPKDQVNILGYASELELFVIFIKALQKCDCFDSKEMLHRYLVEVEFNPERLEFLRQSRIKNLFQDSQRLMQTLDELFIGCETPEMEAFKMSDIKTMKMKCSILKQKLDDYFGESRDEVPSYLSEMEKCEYRYRRVKSKGVKFFKYLSISINNTEQLKIIEESCNLLLVNLQDQFCCFKYLKLMLDAVTVLVINRKLPSHISYGNLLIWSYQLCFKYALESSIECDCLEAYFYFFIFHFPNKDRNSGTLPCSSSAFLDALKRWEHAFERKLKQQHLKDKRYNDSPLFCLGKGGPLDDLVFLGNSINKTEFNDLLSSKKRELRFLSGTLNNRGNKVQLFVHSKEGRCDYEIPTSCHIKKSHWWQKKVYFYLGFCLSGLKAYCVTNTRPEEM